MVSWVIVRTMIVVFSIVELVTTNLGMVIKQVFSIKWVGRFIRDWYYADP